MFTLLLLIGEVVCSGVPKRQYAGTPVEESEFLLSKELLLEKYEDVSKYSVAAAPSGPLERPSYEELEKRWGKPEKVQNSWENYLSGLGYIVSLGLVLSPDNLLVSALGAAAVLSATPKPPQNKTWRKGNYIIEADFQRYGLFGSDEKLVYWDWYHSNSEGEYKERSRPVERVDKGSYWQLLWSRGGDGFASNANDDVLHVSDHTMLLFGNSRCLKRALT